MNGNIAIGGILAIVAIIIVMLLFVVYPWLGEKSRTPVELKDWEEVPCDTNRFAQDYGIADSGYHILLNEKDFFVTRFSENWTVPIDAKTCRIVEDYAGALERFRVYEYDSKIQSIQDDLYDYSMSCVRSAKGAAVACEIVTPINDVLDAPITAMISTIPTKYSEHFAESLVSDGWKSDAKLIAGTTSRLVKTVKGCSPFTVTLVIIDEASCPMGESIENAIFDYCNEANQVFRMAKDRQYISNTIGIMDGYNEYIISLQNARQNVKGDIFDWGRGLWLEITSGLENPSDCNPQIQATKLKNYQDAVSNVNTEAENRADDFISKLNGYKTEADDAMSLVFAVKKDNAPDAIKFLILTGKSVEYQITEQESERLYRQQLYVSAKKAAGNETGYYVTFWENVKPIDYVLSVIWIIIGVVLIIAIKISRRNDDYNLPYTQTR